MANRLAGALSPYLQQHADNPVDWFEWGDDAFALARQRDVPVFLSVGYAACHWCHVMAHESFEDPRIARQLNDGFVCIKVDREERPDIDTVYMRATGLLTGSGGWPMSVFLDHEGRPFHAGTYFPPHDSRGMPGFPRVLATLSEVWRTDRPRVDAIAAQVAAALAADGPGHRQDGLDVAEQSESTDWSRLTGEAVHDLQQSFDPVAGGFGGAPKFPPSMVLEFLLRHSARTGDAQSLAMAEATLQAMARGGLYDQLAGGFARYSTDDRWIVPHFEKMLYDNALLARVYLHWWRATGDPLARRIAVETLDFMIDEMRTPEGGFASSLDADSPPLLPGQNPEGAFYVWTPGQVAQALADLSPTDVQRVGDWLGVTSHGNFEAGTSVLQLPVDPDAPGLWLRARQLLVESRSRRSRPAIDDKVVAGWNGLAIAALAEAAVVLSRPDYLNAAAAAADLLVTTHRSESGAWSRVSRSGRRGRAAAVLEDLGGMAEGFLALYQASGDIRWYDLAEEVLEGALADHGDGAGGFWETANSAERLVARTKESADNATPSGWALVCGALVQVAALDGGSQWRDAAEDAVRALLAQPAARQPRFFGWGLAVVEAMLAGPVEVAVIGAGDDAAALRRAALSSPTPVVVAVGVAGSDRPALLAGRPGGEGAVAYVCRRFTCAAPTSDAGRMSAQIRGEAADSEG